jgi:hypothetical protein
LVLVLLLPSPGYRRDEGIDAALEAVLSEDAWADPADLL